MAMLHHGWCGLCRLVLLMPACMRGHSSPAGHSFYVVARGAADDGAYNSSTATTYNPPALRDTITVQVRLATPASLQAA